MPQSPSAYLIFLFCALCLLVSGCALRRSTSSTPDKISLDVLFVAYDNGDGRAFKALLPELEQKNIHWHLIAFGPAAQLFTHSENITILDQQVSEAVAGEWFRNRRANIPDAIAIPLTDKFDPQLVITGMAHAEQARLMRRWWNEGAKTVAFYDNFESVSGQPWAQAWLEVPPSAEYFLVPSENALKDFPKARKGAAQVVQHPVLQQWHTVIQQQDKSRLKTQLGLSDKPVVLIAGGYGKAYEQSLETILAAAEKRDDLQWLLAPHPRTSGALETQHPLIIRSDTITVVSDIATPRLAAIASVMVTYNSTSGWFAAQLGIPSLFVRPQEQPVILIPDRLQVVNSEASLLNALHRVVDRQASLLLTKPRPTATTITAELEKLLREPRPQQQVNPASE